MNQYEPLYKLLDWIDINKLDWISLSQNSNPNAIDLLEKNPDKIYWDNLSLNPNAIHLLEKNQDKINWYYLFKNSNAIHLFEKNPDKINWNMLSENPSMFEIDYRTMKKQMVDIYFEELMMVTLHPKRISKWLDDGFEDF